MLAFLLRRRWQLFWVAVLLGSAATLVGRELALDRSIENMFAPNDPILQPYRKLQRTFGEHEILIAVYPDDQLTTPAGLARIEQLATTLQGIPGVASVVSLLDPPLAAQFDDDPRGVAFREVFAGYTHNGALDAAGIVCLIERPVADDSLPAATQRRRTLASIRDAVRDRPGGVLVGEPVLIEEAFDLLEQDGRRLNTWCTLLVMLTIVLSFGSWRWAILPLAVVQLALATTRATLVLSGLQLSMVSSMLSAIVTVVGVATVVHVIVRYRDGLLRDLTPLDALEETWRQLAKPVALACLTDAAGFASLMISEVGPVHDFGLMMAIGSLLVLPCAALAIPALTSLGPSPSRGDEPRARRSRLDAALGFVLVLTRRHGRMIAVGGVATTALLAMGAQWLERETDFTKNFRADSSLVKAYDFFETRFGGAGVWDVMAPISARPTKNELMKVLALEQTLRSEAPGLTKAISIADLLDAGLGGVSRIRMQFAINGAMSLLRARMPEFVDASFHADPADDALWMRVMLRSPERLEAKAKTRLIAQVRRQAQEAYPEAEVTGYYVLLTQLIESVLADQWKTFAVAALAVVFMMAVGFRSMRLAIIAMIPNVLPVLALFGAMGWLGVRINMGAAMIAAVSVGLSVDGSIHYLMDYQRRRRMGLSCEVALAEVQSSVGRAAVLATLALVVGFTTLATSDFVPTIYFGLLVSLSMAGGLVGNLVGLPLLIRTVEPAESLVADDREFDCR